MFKALNNKYDQDVVPSLTLHINTTTIKMIVLYYQ